MTSCTVIIVEDHATIAHLMADFLHHQTKFSVTAIVHTAEAARVEIALKKPDLVILDLGLPDISAGLSVLRSILVSSPESKVLVFSAVCSARVVREALQQGAYGFLEKTAPLPDLLKALETVRGGGTFLGEQASMMLREAIRNEINVIAPTPEEASVLKLLAKGVGVKEIADGLNISASMVYKLLTGMRTKYATHSNHDLIMYALRNGLLEIGSPYEGKPQTTGPIT